MTAIVGNYCGNKSDIGVLMENQSKSGQLVNRHNASVLDIVLFRGKRYEIDEISQFGVWLKLENPTDAREFIYFFETQKFGVIFA